MSKRLLASWDVRYLEKVLGITTLDAFALVIYLRPVADLGYDIILKL